MIEVKFADLLQSVEAEGTVILMDEVSKIAKNSTTLQEYDSYISPLLTKQTHLFTGKYGQIKVLTALDNSKKLKHVFVVGIGNETNISAIKLERLGGKVLNEAKKHGISSLAVDVNFNIHTFSAEDIAVLMARGVSLASYSFDVYMTDARRVDEKNTVKRITFRTKNHPHAFDRYQNEGQALVEGIFFARNCISTPANHLNPKTYAQAIKDTLSNAGVEVEILNEAQMRELNMGALLGVGQGSQHESQLVVMKYYGADNKAEAPIALVGKGVTFDTGGICIKPSEGMWQMKYDMSGSAAVAGTINALALRKAKINIVGVVGLVENMPDGNAQRPGDIVKTMSGKTIEVIDTDAEGRLVLADALWYAQERFNPKLIIDIATLTGAIRIALGGVYAGLFANTDELADRLYISGIKSGEKVWRMPLHKDYEQLMKSEIADIANISLIERRSAGSCTAANFLQYFIKPGTTWAHLDLAGVAWEFSGKDLCPKGAVAFGIRLIHQLIKDYYESQ